MSGEADDFHLTLQVRNNRLRARRVRLCMSNAQLCESAGVGYSEYGELETLKSSPLRADGRWRLIALKLAEFYSCEPEDLFPDHINAVRVSKFEKTMSERELSGFAPVPQITPDDAIVAGELSASVRRALHSLTPTERDVLCARFGLDDQEPKTQEEIGDKYNISKGRVVQIEAKALRKLRHPSRSVPLKPFIAM